MTALIAASSTHQALEAASARARPASVRWMRFTGLAFIVGAILVNVPYSLLIANFDYPDILRAPTGEILTKFADGGTGLIFTWLGFAWSAAPILIGILLLQRVLEADGQRLASAATLFGVIGGVIQMVGLLRWPFVVPGIAATYTATGASPATKSAAEVTFDAVHQYGGVVLGEHLGQAFTIAWIVLVAAMMFRSRIFRPWLGWVGLAAAAIYSLAQLELIATVVPDFPSWDAAGLIGSLLWLAWMVLLGVQILVASRRQAPTSEIRSRLDVLT